MKKVVSIHEQAAAGGGRELSVFEINSTPEELWQEFAAYCDVKPRTLRNYKQGVRRFVAALVADGIDFRQLYITDTMRLRAAFISFRDRAEEELSASTAQLYVTAAKIFVRWLASKGLCNLFCDHVKTVKVSEGHKRDALSKDQSRELIQSFDTSTLIGARNKAITALMLSTGLRCIEVARADVGDIEMTQGRWFLRVHGKMRSGKDESVAIPAPVKELLDAYLTLRAESSVAAPLFASCSNRNHGGRLSTCTISKMIKAALKRIGLDSRRLVAHSLRHSFVTQALLAGVAEKDVIQVARHKSANVISIYRHDLDRIKNTAEDTVAAAIFG